VRRLKLITTLSDDSDRNLSGEISVSACKLVNLADFVNQSKAACINSSHMGIDKEPALYRFTGILESVDSTIGGVTMPKLYYFKDEKLVGLLCSGRASCQSNVLNLDSLHYKMECFAYQSR